MEFNVILFKLMYSGASKTETWYKSQGNKHSSSS